MLQKTGSRSYDYFERHVANIEMEFLRFSLKKHEHDRIENFFKKKRKEGVQKFRIHAILFFRFKFHFCFRVGWST